MNCFKTLAGWRLRATAMLALALVPMGARAAWVGLADGNYTVNLSCDFSSVIACPGNIQGSLSIAGGSATNMSVLINGDFFSGDPVDSIVDGAGVDFENVSLTIIPDLRFLSLRLITAGQIGSYGVGDLWWVYCNNVSATTCTPNTTGIWSAQAVAAVPEPATVALVPLALLGLIGARAARKRASALHHRPFLGLSLRILAPRAKAQRAEPVCARATLDQPFNDLSTPAF